MYSLTNSGWDYYKEILTEALQWKTTDYRKGQLKKKEKLLGIKEYNSKDEQLKSNHSKVFVLVVRKVTILTNYSF